VHYLHRVAAYKSQVDGGQVALRIFEYPLAFLRAEPELLVISAVVFVRWWPDREERRALAGYLHPAALLATFVFVLVGLSVRGGAPTHHPERALHVVHLFVALVTARLGLQASGEAQARAPSRLRHGARARARDALRAQLVAVQGELRRTARGNRDRSRRRRERASG
jgi:hypothetical protein